MFVCYDVTICYAHVIIYYVCFGLLLGEWIACVYNGLMYTIIHGYTNPCVLILTPNTYAVKAFSFTGLRLACCLVYHYILCVYSM